MNENKDISRYARELFLLARDTITVKYRYFDIALAKIELVEKINLGGFSCDGERLYYDPVVLLRAYMEEQNIAARIYMHILLHLVFLHQFKYDRLNKKYWCMACDIAVENIIHEMEMGFTSLSKDEEAEGVLTVLKKNIPDGKLTADSLYREFMVNNPSMDMEKTYKRLFTIDNHNSWTVKTKLDSKLTIEEWEKITQRVKTDLNAFSKNKVNNEGLAENIDKALKKKYDYKKILERFMVNGEEMSINDEEFDYIYYTYGLSEYGDLPLIEPLEYKETKKVKEFILAIDTSSSCSGKIVKQFITRTYDILSSAENYFNHVNIHIIQCDQKVRMDTKICSKTDFLDFIANGRIVGSGSTDFRPVFEYVDELKQKGEFESLKGLIYFTDGYGIYPETMPDYDVIFAFLNEDDSRPIIPTWAIKVVLEND